MSGCRWTTLEELEQRRSEWRELLSRSEFPSAFADPGWVLAWWRSYGSGREPWCLVLEDARGSLAGVAPLALGGVGLARALTFAGDEWNGLDALVCAHGREAEFAELLTTELARRRSEWEVWRVRRLPADTQLARVLARGSGGLRAAALDMRAQPYLPLPPTLEEFDARFPSRTRNTRRRKAKRLAALGARARAVDEPAEARAALRRLLALRAARAQELGQDHAYMDERYERFLADALAGMLPHCARLWTLEAGGETLAMKLSLLAGPREHGYVVGLSAAHREASPGMGLERHAIEAAIAEGRTEIELGPGHDRYKYEWGAVDRQVARVVVRSGSARARIAAAPAALDVRLRASAAAAAIRRRRGD